jgi:tetratricopeptide (TPR) repeat protein
MLFLLSTLETYPSPGRNSNERKMRITLLFEERRYNEMMLLVILAVVVLLASLSSVDGYILTDRRRLGHLQIPPAIHGMPLFRGNLQASTHSIASVDSSLDSRWLARQYIQDGMLAFRVGNVSKSIELFNLAEQTDASMAPFLWQRGLSYYYANDFDNASQQFRLDVRVNPYDVEEIVWDIASQLQSSRNQRPQLAPVFPIPNQLSLPAGSTDRRRIMVSYFGFGVQFSRIIVS